MDGTLPTSHVRKLRLVKVQWLAHDDSIRKRLSRKGHQVHLCQVSSNCLSPGPHSLGREAHSEESLRSGQWTQIWKCWGQERSRHRVAPAKDWYLRIQNCNTHYARSPEPHQRSWPAFSCSICLLEHGTSTLTLLNGAPTIPRPWGIQRSPKELSRTKELFPASSHSFPPHPTFCANKSSRADAPIAWEHRGWWQWHPPSPHGNSGASLNTDVELAQVPPATAQTWVTTTRELASSQEHQKASHKLGCRPEVQRKALNLSPGSFSSLYNFVTNKQGPDFKHKLPST